MGLFGKKTVTTPRNTPKAPENDPHHLDLPENKSKYTIDDFDLLKVLGKGGFGKVMLVRKKGDPNGPLYAMKVLRKEAVIRRNQVQHTKTERRILQDVAHPFTTNMVYAFQTSDKLYMVLSYCGGGELFYQLKKEGRFPEDRVRLYSAEIILALGHLHSLDIVYRDLKPENILLDVDGHACLTDFGLSKEAVTGPDSAKTFCGTPEYLAPEILSGKGHGKSVDWWSMGTLIFEMLTGLPPFYSRNVNQMYEKILKAELKCPPYLSEEAKDLVSRMLIRDPAKRLGGGPGNVEEIKPSPFFSPALDWNKVFNKEYTPLYKPKVNSATDTSNFDPQFTREIPQDSLVEGGALNEKFEDFTFTPESELKK